MADIKQEKDIKTSLPKLKSPGYPQIGLVRCIELVRKVYDGAHTGEIDNQTLIRLMGLSMGGQGLSVAGAVKKFGLIEGRGEKLKVSHLALQILVPMSENEKNEALREAALKPELYSEILSRFGGKVPADEVMRSFLIRQYLFAPTGADNFIKAFRETMDAIPSSITSVQPSETNTQEVNPSSFQASSVRNDAPVTLQSVETTHIGERLSFRLSPTAKVHVLFEGEINPSAIDKLIKFLELSKDSYSVDDSIFD